MNDSESATTELIGHSQGLKKRKMEGCSSSLDRISDLPSHVSQIILVSLPLRDMARTSILSKSWRYQWLKVPQLVFKDDPRYLISRDEKYRYTAMKVFQILLLHHGPISKFILDMTAWTNYSVIDTIIPFLSRKGIKQLSLLMPDKKEFYKLPSSILSCVEHLSLTSCVLQPFNIGDFAKLVSLELSNVTFDSDVSISSYPFLESLKLDVHHESMLVMMIDAPNLKILNLRGVISRIRIDNTPLLKVLSLIGKEKESYTGNSSSDLINLLQSLPLLEELCICYWFLHGLAKDNSSVTFPKSLNNLKMLELISVDAWDMEDLSSTLCFIRNSPNLKLLKFGRFGHSSTSLTVQTGSVVNLMLLEHACDPLLQLQEVEILLIYDWCYLRRDMHFFKFLLDISPALKKLYIEPPSNNIDTSGYKMLMELAWYGRASPKSEIVYAGVDLS